MNCEEFEAIGLDAGTGRVTGTEAAAAVEHAAICAKCASLADAWDAARAELSFLREETGRAEAPARVEMRLLQELRAQKRPIEIYRRAGMIAAWALAAAAAIFGVFTWQSWRSDQQNLQVKKNIPTVGMAQVGRSEEDLLVADGDAGAFTPLPGALPVASSDGSIYEVRMQRASLGALGLPVSEDRASDWINVDLLVADDGTPQGVRLHEDVTESASLQ